MSPLAFAFNSFARAPSAANLTSPLTSRVNCCGGSEHVRAPALWMSSIGPKRPIVTIKDSFLSTPLYTLPFKWNLVRRFCILDRPPEWLSFGCECESECLGERDISLGQLKRQTAAVA